MVQASGRRARPGARRARREARQRLRDERFGRFVWLTAVGSLIPGVGLIAAGRRGWGQFVLVFVGLGVLALGVLVWSMPRRQLAVSAFDQSTLAVATVALALVASGWLVVAVASHRSLEPVGLSHGRRLVGALIVVVTASLVLTPMVYAARITWAQHELLSSVSAPRSGEQLDECCEVDHLIATGPKGHERPR